VTSTLTLLDVLVVPYRVGNAELAQRYEAVLVHSPGIRLIDLTSDHLRLAVQLRARIGVHTPDALQLAALLGVQCPAFATNNRRLLAVLGLTIVQLSAYET
jgi:predicted nucleic acid-binding protein